MSCKEIAWLSMSTTAWETKVRRFTGTEYIREARITWMGQAEQRNAR